MLTDSGLSESQKFAFAHAIKAGVKSSGVVESINNLNDKMKEFESQIGPDLSVPHSKYYSGEVTYYTITPGTYYLEYTLIVPSHSDINAEGCTFIGIGNFETAALIANNPVHGHAYNIKWKGGTIKAGGAANSMNFIHATNVEVVNLRVEGSSDHGIELNSVTNAHVHNCYFSAPTRVLEVDSNCEEAELPYVSNSTWVKLEDFDMIWKPDGIPFNWNVGCKDVIFEHNVVLVSGSYACHVHRGGHSNIVFRNNQIIGTGNFGVIDIDGGYHQNISCVDNVVRGDSGSTYEGLAMNNQAGPVEDVICRFYGPNLTKCVYLDALMQPSKNIQATLSCSVKNTAQVKGGGGPIPGSVLNSRFEITDIDTIRRSCYGPTGIESTKVLTFT
jgi:hypothetical protein